MAVESACIGVGVASRRLDALVYCCCVAIATFNPFHHHAAFVVVVDVVRSQPA